MKPIQHQSEFVKISSSDDPPSTPFITSAISQRKTKDSCESFEVFSRSVRIKRPPMPHLSFLKPPDREGTTLDGFSSKSRARLRFTACNAAEHLISQFCMTYHRKEDWPKDGRELKKHLNTFLTDLRRNRPGTKYLWIGEFQMRGAPHFHLFTDLEVNQENHKFLGDAWHRVSGCTQEAHLKVHLHNKNFIPWDMGTGQYLTKYLDKTHQKFIPKGFENFGRWWGNSTNIKPKADIIPRDELDLFLSESSNLSTGEVLVEDAPQFIIRTLRKYQKKVTKGRVFRKQQSMTVLTGAEIFKKTLQHLEGLSERRFDK